MAEKEHQSLIETYRYHSFAVLDWLISDDLENNRKIQKNIFVFSIQSQAHLLFIIRQCTIRSATNKCHKIAQLFVKHVLFDNSWYGDFY